jgi:hypothetical protein
MPRKQTEEQKAASAERAEAARLKLKAEMEEHAKLRREQNAKDVREKIQTTQLVNTLQGFALGTSKAKLTPARIKAIEMLLDKTLPNLASFKHEVDAKQVVFMIDTNFNGNPENPVPPTGSDGSSVSPE